MPMSYPKRVAVVGVGHWHSTHDAALIHEAYRLGAEALN
jgi:hypothetical protein